VRASTPRWRGANHLSDRHQHPVGRHLRLHTVLEQFITPVFLSSPEKKTVPVGVVSELIRGDIYFWGQLMAGALLGSIPVALVYSFFVEYYVTGLTGSVKG
jgi:ABC-type glycerol-3-phosphate transport system permease component